MCQCTAANLTPFLIYRVGSQKSDNTRPGLPGRDPGALPWFGVGTFLENFRSDNKKFTPKKPNTIKYDESAGISPIFRRLRRFPHHPWGTPIWRISELATFWSKKSPVIHGGHELTFSTLIFLR